MLSGLDVTILLSYIVSSFLFLSTPGPVTLFVIGRARGGKLSILKAILGTNLASFVLIAASAALTLGALELPSQLWVVFQALGAGYLIFLGWSMWQAQGGEDGQIRGGSNPERSIIFQGFLLGISNPKDILFFMAFFPQFFVVTPEVSTSLITLSLTWLVLDYAVLFTLAWGATRMLTAERLGGVERLSGLFFMGIGVWGCFKSALDFL